VSRAHDRVGSVRFAILPPDDARIAARVPVALGGGGADRPVKSPHG
jgi:hypothetical protein